MGPLLPWQPLFYFVRVSHISVMLIGLLLPWQPLFYFFRVSHISVMLIGLLFLLMFLFNGNLFNNTASTTPITVIQG